MWVGKGFGGKDSSRGEEQRGIKWGGHWISDKGGG